MSDPPTSVWLLNMGGPDSPAAIRPFLFRLLNDPDVVRFPIRWLQWLFALVVSWRRSRAVRTEYARMGDASPQLEMVREQAAALSAELGEGFTCVPVFRYWGESARDARGSLAPGQRVVLLSLYPHACAATTTTSLKDARRALRGHDGPVHEIESYPDHEGFVATIQALVDEAVTELGDAPCEVLFSAHGTPASWVEEGDPYLPEVLRTVAAVVEGRAWTHHLSFQSRVGPVEWLRPYTVEMVATLGEGGCPNLIVVPVAFTSEHIETLVELDHQVREVAEQAGVERFVRVPTVGLRPTFIRALADLTRGAVAS